MILGIDLDGIFDVIEGNEYELTVFLCTVSLMLAFALGCVVVERAKRSPVEKIVKRRRAF
jgi:hypothetical protein